VAYNDAPVEHSASPMNEATRLANLAMEKRGYLVIMSIDPDRRVGDRLDGLACGWLGDIPGPLLVAAETDRADMEAQVSDVPWPEGEYWAGYRYFRVVAEFAGDAL
jgi:hypothetical protein